MDATTTAFRLTRTQRQLRAQVWLAKHPRVEMQITPTSAPWLNTVERFFRDVSENRPCRGAVTSGPELFAAIDGHIKHRNSDRMALCCAVVRQCP